MADDKLKTKEEIIEDLRSQLIQKEMECEFLKLKLSALESHPITKQTALWDKSVDVNTDYELIIHLLYNRIRELTRDVHTRDVRIESLSNSIKRKKQLGSKDAKELKKQNEIIKKEQDKIKAYALKPSSNQKLKSVKWDSDEDLD